MTAPAQVQQTPGWLRDHIPDLFGLATALTGSAETAADLVAQTIIRTPSRLNRQSAPETADDDLLALLVDRFLATHRRRTAGIAAVGQLGALSPPARAAVVLRDGVGMTPMTIASVLDRPPAQVNADLATAGPCAEEVALLRAGATDFEQVHRRLAAARRRIRTRRRRLVALGTVIVLLIGAAVSVPTFWLPRLPAEVRLASVWRFSHVVRPPRGWTLTSRTLTTTTETTQFQPPGRENDGCLVTVHTAGSFDGTETIRLTGAQVHGRDGFVGQNRSGNYLLAWEYAPHAWAEVSCAVTRLDESLLVRTAERVRFRSAPARIPYRLTALPQGYRVLSLTEYPSTGSTELYLGRDDIEGSEPARSAHMVRRRGGVASLTPSAAPAEQGKKPPSTVKVIRGCRERSFCTTRALLTRPGVPSANLQVRSLSAFLLLRSTSSSSPDGDFKPALPP